MVLHYIKLTIRNLLNNKIYSLISILGLTIGFACAFTISFFIIRETSFDTCHKKKRQIYRVLIENEDIGSSTPLTPSILTPTLKSEFPEILRVTRIFRLNTNVKINNKLFNESNIQCVDTDFFDIFSIKLERGQSLKLQPDPNYLLISKKLALKYFGNLDVLGKTLSVNINEETYELVICGVFQDLPFNSTFKAEIIINISMALKKTGISQEISDSWETGLFETYILLPKDHSVASLAKKLSGLKGKYFNESLNINFRFQNLKKVYLRSFDLINNKTTQGEITKIYLYAGIGLLILITAGINYIILTIAKSVTRLKEIGIRKVIGASRLQLTNQLMGEAIWVSYFSLPLGITLSILFLNTFSRYVGFELVFDFQLIWKYSVILLLIPLLVGVFSGIYISYYITAISPINCIRNINTIGKANFFFRRLLISIQLIIFIVLVILSLTLKRQLHYAQKMDLGFNKENLITIYGYNFISPVKFESFKNEISKNPNILEITSAMFLPPSSSMIMTKIPSLIDPTKKIELELLGVGYNFIETFEFVKLDGRLFEESRKGDIKKSIIISESVIKTLGITNPIGKYISFDNEKHEIIGVVKDFSIHSIRKKISPTIIVLRPDIIYNIAIRINPINNYGNTFKYIDDKLDEFFPNESYIIRSFDDALMQMYSSEIKFSKIILFFTYLSILLAIAGLYGLSLFLAERRTKEIGIRKVFGATSKQIVLLMYKEFSGVIVLGVLLAIPLALYFSNLWLSQFVYKVKFGFLTFIFAAIISGVIVIITVSYQSFRIANMNPADVIKYE